MTPRNLWVFEGVIVKFRVRSCGIPITIGIRQYGHILLPLRIPLQISAKCMSDIKTPNHTVSFDIDDSAITENGFICSNVDPRGLTGNMFSLTNANPFCVKTYSEKQSNSYFQVYFGQCLGLDWVYLDVICNPSHLGDPLSPGCLILMVH